MFHQKVWHHQSLVIHLHFMVPMDSLDTTQETPWLWKRLLLIQLLWLWVLWVPVDLDRSWLRRCLLRPPSLSTSAWLHIIDTFIGHRLNLVKLLPWNVPTILKVVIAPRNLCLLLKFECENICFCRYSFAYFGTCARCQLVQIQY